MARDWESWFQTAAQPASANEEAKRDRTEERVRKAIRGSSEIPSSIKIYVKGSYKTNTNVRQDADVDICVEWQDFYYVDTWGKTEGMGPAELK
jgi:tRNA nucleotidyltransferase (CCA-adding enzyme)